MQLDEERRELIQPKRAEEDQQTIEELQLALENHRCMMLEMELEVEEAQSIAESARRDSAAREQQHAEALRRAAEDVAQSRMAYEREAAAAQRVAQEGSRAENQSAAALHRTLVAMNCALQTMHNQEEADRAARESAQAEVESARAELAADKAQRAQLQASAAKDRQQLLQRMERLVNEHKASSQRQESKILQLGEQLADSRADAEEIRQQAARAHSALDGELAQKSAINEELLEVRRETERLVNEHKASSQRQESKMLQLSEELADSRAEAARLQSALDNELAQKNEQAMRTRQTEAREASLREELSLVEQGFADYKVLIEHLLRDLSSTQQELLHAVECCRMAEVTIRRERVGTPPTDDAVAGTLEDRVAHRLGHLQVSYQQLQDTTLVDPAVESEEASAAICTQATRLALTDCTVLIDQRTCTEERDVSASKLEAQQADLCSMLQAALQSAVDSTDATDKLVGARMAELAHCQVRCKEQQDDIDALTRRIQQLEWQLRNETADRAAWEIAVASAHKVYVGELRKELQQDKDKECADLKAWKVRACTRLAEQIVAMQNEHQAKICVLQSAQEGEARKMAAALSKLSAAAGSCAAQRDEIATLTRRAQQLEERLRHETVDRIAQEIAWTSAHKVCVAERSVAAENGHKANIHALQSAHELEAGQAAAALSELSAVVCRCADQREEVARAFEWQRIERVAAQDQLAAMRQDHAEELARHRERCEQQEAAILRLRARAQQHEQASRDGRGEFLAWHTRQASELAERLASIGSGQARTKLPDEDAAAIKAAARRRMEEEVARFSGATRNTARQLGGQASS